VGPEVKLYKKIRKATPTILWNRIENLSVPGMPDTLAYNKNHLYFTVEFKVTRSNKVRLSPHQIAYHVTHPHNSFICIQALGPGIIKLYEGSVVRDLAKRGLELEPLCLALEACAFLFLVACNDSGAAKHGSLFLFVITSVNKLTSVEVWIVLLKEVS